MAICCLSASAQVEFSKFKLSKDEPFGAFPGRKMLNTKFKVTADRDLKYLLVDYYIVNAVGDVISGVTKGFKNDTLEYIKPKRMECTGPFKAGKSFSPWVSGVVTDPNKDITAFPFQIQVMYMGTEEWIMIPITKENLATYFPCLQWMEYSRKNKKIL
jgi:hypothetical protein